MTISKFAAVATLLALFSLPTLAQTYIPPQGRLTLTSATPVMQNDVTGASTIYYVDYVGPVVPLCQGGSGSKTYSSAKASYPMTLTLTSSQTAGQIYDIFFFADTIHGGFQIGLGPAWSSSTSRGTGAGTTQISQNYLDAVWRNDESFTPVNGTLTLPNLSACNGTYLGSVYMTGNGQTSFQLKPTMASGGTGNVVGIWNAYNRVPISPISRDSTFSWTNTASSWGEANSSSNNRITWIDGLGQTAVSARYTVLGSSNTSTNLTAFYLGVNHDSTSANPDTFSALSSLSGPNFSEAVEESFPPQGGLNYIQAMEQVSGTTPSATFYGDGFQALILRTEY